jgi:High potential iron-sulfur protein
MSEHLSRRDALKNLAIAAGVIAVPALRTARAADLPHVTPQDPVAMALAYHEDASTVKAADFPSYKPEQKCSTCAQAKGADGDAWRPCNLFPNKEVNANGWCKVWVKKA